ncbi:hypothetical protein HYS96_03380 [Candidatus Daviesbacteria bacterium]|nr:hypothetical protein [Candidatus Daviesbacteria bacterium]
MWIKILLLFFTFSFLFRTDRAFDQDLGRHLKLGEIIVQTHQVPKTNLFSYTNPDFPFINTHWLFEVLVYFFHQTVGLTPLLFLKIVIFLSSVLLIIKIIPKEKTALLLPVGFIFLHVLRERTELRPEIFSFLFTALTYYILEKFTSSLRANTVSVAISQNNQIASSPSTNAQDPRNDTAGKLIFFLPIIQLIWINTHIYFFVGLALQAVFLIHSISRKIRLLSTVLLLSILISLINPNGLTGLIYPLNVTKNYGYTIVENQTMFLLESINFKDPNFLFVKLSAVLIGLSLLVAFFRKNWQMKNILLPVGGLVLALLNVRSFPYLVFLSLPATMQNFGVIPWNKLTKTLTIVAAALLLFESYFYLNGDYYRFNDQPVRPNLEFAESTKGALDFMISKDLPKPLFNNFDIGSYIIYRAFPKYQIFVDGRPEAYPAQFFNGIYIPGQSDYNNFKELEKIYGFKTIIFSHTDQTPWGRNFLQSVIKDEAWKLVYIDDFAVVLTTTETINQKQLPIIDPAKLDPTSYQFGNHVSYLRLGLFLLNNQYIESGRQFILKTLQLFPDDPIASLILGQRSKNIYLW